MIRSGDRIPTGTGAARRRLTLAEAEAGGLPEPMTREEWRAMAEASRHDHERLIFEALQHHSAARLNAAQHAKATAPHPQWRRQPPPPVVTPTVPPTHHVTKTEVHCMIKLARDGHTLPQIAEAVGRCKKTVSWWLRAYDIRTRRGYTRRTPEAP
jgi:hypothetical protein